MAFSWQIGVWRRPNNQPRSTANTPSVFVFAARLQRNLVLRLATAMDRLMRLIPLLAPMIALVCVDCGNAQTGEAARNPLAKGAPGASVPPFTQASPSPYRVLGILDPDREQMAAFAFKVPSDWRAQQAFYRKWSGAVATPQISVTLTAPEGRSQIVFFPSTQYLFGEGPLSNGLRAQKRAMGMPEQNSPDELPPMSPLDYLQRIFLPQLAQNGVNLREVGNPQNAPQTRGENGQTQLRGSVDGMLANGNRARIECRISVFSRQMGSDIYHNWNAIPSITQTATGDLEAIHAHTRVAQDSFVSNPAWQKLEQATQARGQEMNRDASRRQHEATMAQLQASTEAMTRGHHERMAAIRQFGETNTANFNQRMTTMDRDQRVRVDTIRGESQYANPTTGERVKVADGYSHVYNSQQHPDLFLGTNTPINPGALDWQELQKVQLKDY